MTPEQFGRVAAHGWDDVLPVRMAVVARELMRALPQMRWETCARGGRFRANRYSPGQEVAMHYRTKRHAAWWAICGWAT